MPSILFVCTGNIFRSMTAEYALKAMLDPRSLVRVSSAGTVALSQEMHPDVRAYLMQRGVDPSHHQQRRVSADKHMRAWHSWRSSANDEIGVVRRQVLGVSTTPY
jgi:protein-tyrosine-phosphatase